MRQGKPPCVEARDTDFGACYGSAVNIVEVLAEHDPAPSPPSNNCKSNPQSPRGTADHR